MVVIGEGTWIEELMRLIVPARSRCNRLHLPSLLLAFAALLALAAPACNSANVASGLVAAEACHENSQCAQGLICALGACTVMCSTAADCVPAGECVFSNDTAACQYKPASCNEQSDCPAPLACASDYHCRNLCTTAAQCNMLGTTGDVCAKDKAGVHFCAPPSDVDGGVLADPPPPGANTAAPVMELDAGVSDGATSGDATTAGHDGGKMDGSPPADAFGDRTVTTHDGGTSDTGSDVSADAPLACNPTCTQMETCIGGASGPTCTPCGAEGLACCQGEQSCGANLSCTANGTCACGAANEACCTGTSCNSGLSCDTDDAGASTCACGEIGTRCCPGVDGGTASCSAGGTCAGSKCGCIVQFAAAGAGTSPGVVLRTDGTVWAAYPTTSTSPFTEMNGNSGPLVATFIAESGTSSSSIGCAIVSGGVWCFPTGETLTDSTDLGAGLGPGDTTSSPVQVLTPVSGGTPLASVMQISGGTSSASNFCAAASDGSAWCWGYGEYGQLGNGGTANSTLASQVMANADTPFADVAEVRIGFESSCARRTDGSVWCWGANSYGELGIPSASMASSYYPVQVPFAGTSAQTTATRLAAGSWETFCAIMQDTSVVCWGYNGSAQAGAPVSNSIGPTSVLVAAGSAPLTGIVDLAGDGSGSMCGKTTDLAVLCWGADSSSTPYPMAYENSAQTAAVGIVAPLSNDYFGLGYIDPDGLLISDGVSTGPVPPCTNLLQ